MQRYRKIQGPAFLQTCTASMIAGFRLIVHKDDSFPMENEDEIQVLISQANGGMIIQKLSFVDDTAEIKVQHLPLDWYTLSLVNGTQHVIKEDDRCCIHTIIDGENVDGNQIRFQLTEETPVKELTMQLFGDICQLHIHVLEEGTSGQHLPKGDRIYQYEFVSNKSRQWVELNAYNHYETVLKLPKGEYSLIAHDNTQAYLDDTRMETALALEKEEHSLMLLEQTQEKAALQIKVFVMDEQCVLTTPKDCYFQVEIAGNDDVQTVNLNEMNDFAIVLYDLTPGMYTIKAHDANGYTILYEVDGEANLSGDVAIQDECVQVDILYQKNSTFFRPSFRIRKRIKTEGGTLTMPKEADCFVVNVAGCGTAYSFYLTKENHFCAELADLCPGCYQIKELDTKEYTSTIQFSDGTPVLDGCIEIGPCKGADILLVNETKRNGKLQICKYEEDENGNLTRPSNHACFAIRLHSFAYQEILMLKEENAYCVLLQDLAKGCYDIREVEGEHVLYSVDQGEWSHHARVVIDDGRLHEIRILNLKEEDCGSIRIEKWIENEHGHWMHPSCMERYTVCITGEKIRQEVVLNVENQWCVYVEGLAYGIYRIEELYGGNERYLINGVFSEDALVQVQKDLQEVKIINPLLSATTLHFSICIVDCQHQLVTPDASFEAIVIIEGDHCYKEISLNESNRWQAILAGLQGDYVRIIQKDTMGYHVLYQVDDQICAGAMVVLDGKNHSIRLIDQFHCHDGILSVEKKCVDEQGCLHIPPQDASYSMQLCGCGIEVPFELNADNGFTVVFDDLQKGEYTLCEIGEEPCCWKVNGEVVENGTIYLDACDMHLEVIDAFPVMPCLHIMYQNEELCCDQLSFALIGNDMHSMYTLANDGQELLIEGILPGTYEIRLQGGQRILFEINGCVYEQGKFAVEQEDVYVVLIKEHCDNTLVLHKFIENRQGAYELETAGISYIRVQSVLGEQEVVLNAANQFTYTLYDLPFGMICIQDEQDPYAQIKVNGKFAENGCFQIQNGSYEAVIIEKAAGGILEIDGCCQKEDTFYECTNQSLHLQLISQKEQTAICLDAENEWHQQLRCLPAGEYTLRSLDQTVCFYLNEMQSYNAITFKVECSLVKIQAVLQEQDTRPLLTMNIQIKNAQGSNIEIADDALFTVRMIGKQFYEMLAFCKENQFQIQQRVTKGTYEFFVNNNAYALYDHTLVNGQQRAIAQYEITQDCKITFVFKERVKQTGTLYIQGYRQDLDCDCLKPPFDSTVLSMVLQGEQSMHSIQLEKENAWREKITGLEKGRYELLGESTGDYCYLVDGKEETKAVVNVDQDMHNIKIIEKTEDLSKGMLLIEAWKWDGKRKEKPDPSFSVWVNVVHDEQQWDLLLNEGNQWLGMIDHLQQGSYQLKTAENQSAVYQIGEQTISNGEIALESAEVHVNILFDDNRAKGSVRLQAKVDDLNGNDGGTWFFLITRPGFEKQVCLDAGNGYETTITGLEDGQYVVTQYQDQNVTYRVDGKSETQHAAFTVDGDAHEVVAILPLLKTGTSTLLVKGEEIEQPLELILQKAGMEKTILLDPANQFQQEIEQIDSGRYSLFAKEGQYLYALDGQSKRSYCTIVFAKDAHCVVVSPAKEDWQIPSFITKEEQEEQKGGIQFRLWSKDERGYLCHPENIDEMALTVGNQKVTLSKENDYQAAISQLQYGYYAISGTKECIFQIDGGSEQKECRINIQSSTMHQINVILVDSLNKRSTTRLVL